MPSMFNCNIVTPEKSIYSGDVSFIALPTSSGEIGIMDKHAPLLSLLSGGELRIKDENNRLIASYAIAGGYVEVDGNHVIVLADHARDTIEIDLQIIEDRISSLTKSIEEAKEKGESTKFLEEELAWVKIQHKVAR